MSCSSNMRGIDQRVDQDGAFRMESIGGISKGKRMQYMTLRWDHTPIR